jgi:nucleotide-binding universal stress UspA family protein
MFDPILVPLDGSQLAECVLPHVVAIFHSFNGEITLLRILEKNQSGSSAQLFDLLNWQIKKTQAALYLEKTKSRLQGSGIQARTTVLEGLVAEGITEYAQNQGMKLIILSSHGHNGLTQWGISSITHKIILSARVVARNREEAGHYLEQVKSRSYLEGIHIQTHLITGDNTAVALHQLGEQEHINMVALSAHGYSGNQQWPYGSMVNNFVLYGKVPLLIVQDLPSKQELMPPELLSSERAER